MRKAAAPSHRLTTAPGGRRRSLAALGARCVEAPVLAAAGLADLHAALRMIPSRRTER